MGSSASCHAKIKATGVISEGLAIRGVAQQHGVGFREAAQH